MSRPKNIIYGNYLGFFGEILIKDLGSGHLKSGNQGKGSGGIEEFLLSSSVLEGGFELCRDLSHIVLHPCLFLDYLK